MAMPIETLKKLIAQAFEPVPYPGDGDSIAKCSWTHCKECERIRQDFRGQTPSSLKQGFLEFHHGSLPLLKPQAFHYFISAYMHYAAAHPDSTVADFTRYSLAPEKYDDFHQKRFKLFSLQQREAVIAFLDYLKMQEIEGDDRDNARYRAEIEAGIRIWKSLV